MAWVAARRDVLPVRGRVAAELAHEAERYRRHVAEQPVGQRLDVRDAGAADLLLVHTGVRRLRPISVRAGGEVRRDHDRRFKPRKARRAGRKHEMEC